MNVSSRITRHHPNTNVRFPPLRQICASHMSPLYRAELDKTYDTFYRQNKLKQLSHSPRISHRQPAPPAATNGSAKPPPSAPRAFKKARTTSESQPSESPSDHRMAEGSPPTQPASRSRSANSSSNRVKMEVDDDSRYDSHAEADSRQHDGYDRERQYDRGRDKDRERERDYPAGKDRERRASSPRKSTGGGGGGGGGSNRDGNGGGGGGGGSRTNSAHTSRRKDRGSAPSHSSYPKGDRTLAERMGL